MNVFLDKYPLKNVFYTALVFSVIISFVAYKTYILDDHYYIYVNSRQPVYRIDEKFLSVALDTSFMRCLFHEMNEREWEKLEELSRLLSPGYLRLGGTEADVVIFQEDIDESKLLIEKSKRSERLCVNGNPNEPLIITGKDWIRINKFAEESKLSFIFDLNVLLRTGSRWNSSNARHVLRFSEEMGLPMDFQLGNEPNSFCHVFNLSISGRQLAKDFDELKGILKSTQGYRNSKLIGPDVTRPKNLGVSSLKYLEDFLKNTNSVDAVSWHQYYLNGRTAVLKDFIDPNTFDVLLLQIEAVVRVVRKFSKTVPIWISETSSAYGTGAPGLSDRFAASFLWLDKLGISAKSGMSVVIRQSLLKGNYALIDEEFSPSPDFWISFFYKNLVGSDVLNITCQTSEEICRYLRFYGHSLSSNSPVEGNIVIFGMNLLNETKKIVPLGMKIKPPVYSFIFSSENGDLRSKSVVMNGKKVTYDKSVYDLFKRRKEVKLPLILTSYSIGFWIVNEIEDGGCEKVSGYNYFLWEVLLHFLTAGISAVMGLLTEGTALSWEETHALADHVREHGIIQFINLYHKLKHRQGDFLKWGDEVEYMIVKFDHEKKTAKLSLRAHEILPILQEAELSNPDSVKSLWRPEYGAYMIEGTPGKPYGGLLSFFNTVETNMKLRREEASAFLKPGEVIMSLTSFPRLGCPDFTDPPAKTTPRDGASKSLFFPDAAIYPGHPRFKTLTRNIRMRRTEKVAINMPIFKDEKTPSPFVEDFEALGDDGESAKAALPDHIYMDAMGFGMGCCCLQLTFQACNIQEARTLYDQLTPLCPIMLALTAASPFYRGKISDVDCRWNVISGSVDCRTPEERGLEPLKNNRFVIPKSRYDSIDSYLSEYGRHYNDVPLIYDEAIYKKLRDADIDDLLAQHIAHLFIRDSVSLFSERVHQNDNEDSDHFENIQSTNWQTMRFKPPPCNSSIGWRVEFRPCEAQITDMENAAIVCFVVLLTRVILSYQLNFIIPISKVDENMQKAQRRNALREQLFWFRKDILTCVSPPEAASRCKNTSGDVYELMSVNHIINGKEGVFPGLIPLINSYLSGMDVDADTHCTIQQYLKLIQRRASGELKTTAAYLRDFVAKHPDYKKDSNISERINYDLLNHVKDIERGKIVCPELLGISIKSKTQEFIPEAVSKAYETNYSNTSGNQMSVSLPQS